MNQKEADELKKLVDSFVVIDDTTNNTGLPPGFPTVEEGEAVTEGGPTPDLNEDEMNKLFRNEIPKDFGWDKVRFIRSKSTGDRVFLEFNGERRWVPDNETLEKIGYSLADVVEVPDEELRDLKEGFGLLSVKNWNEKDK